MEQLGEIYKKSFFGKRYRLDWRAAHICDAVRTVFGIEAGKSVIDVGCAIGEYVAEFNRQGFEADGIEGSPAAVEFMVSDRIFIHDLRMPLPRGFPNNYDVCMSLEVAEHIEPEFADQYVETLMRLSNNILLTAAPPGQGGHHHVNCQDKQYWESKFFHHGYHRAHLKERIFKDCLRSVNHRREIRVYTNNVMIFRR